MGNQVEKLGDQLKQRDQEVIALKELLSDKDEQHKGELEKKL
jgi:hypothetical protein